MPYTVPVDRLAAIARLIAEHEARNEVVLYEGLGSLTESEIAELSPQERSVYRALAPLHGLYRALAQSLRLVFQGEALNETDPLLMAIDDPARRGTLIARPEGPATWRMDIRLQGDGETVFLDV